ncbi:hypothetical protein [Thiorhodospira sibirica]|uniref:hypothetical protein n=1 Tax=Thiorhodospira sibirica TaxID=154347 RepID=UPI00022C5DB8|nr:hypothetical protein [Thiorhodospira sibirica]
MKSDDGKKPHLSREERLGKVDELYKKWQFLEGRERTLAHEIKQEEQRSKRLALLVYPSLVAFFILSAYGFFLIASLTRDVNRLAVEVTAMTVAIERDIPLIANNMVQMSELMMHMNRSMHAMNQSMEAMKNDTGSMAQSTHSMQSDTRQMSRVTAAIHQDLWSLNQNVSKPFNMMNTMMPWGGGVNQGPFPGSPGPMPPFTQGFPWGGPMP